MNKDHHADIEPAEGYYQATLDGTLIASSRSALLLTEKVLDKTLTPVVYFPIGDCVSEYFTDSGHQTFCGIKGDAHYYHLTIDGNQYEDSVWYYPEPMAGVSQLKGYVAFFNNQIEIEEVSRQP